MTVQLTEERVRSRYDFKVGRWLVRMEWDCLKHVWNYTKTLRGRYPHGWTIEKSLKRKTVRAAFMRLQEELFKDLTLELDDLEREIKQRRERLTADGIDIYRMGYTNDHILFPKKKRK